MNSRFQFAAIVLMMGWTAVASAASTAEAAKAGERCESAVAETVRHMRGRDAQEVQFVGAKRVLTPTSDEEETEVKGEGRYRGSSASGSVMSFAYSCAGRLRNRGRVAAEREVSAGGPHRLRLRQPAVAARAERPHHTGRPGGAATCAGHELDPFPLPLRVRDCQRQGRRRSGFGLTHRMLETVPARVTAGLLGSGLISASPPSAPS